MHGSERRRERLSRGKVGDCDLVLGRGRTAEALSGVRRRDAGGCRIRAGQLLRLVTTDRHQSHGEAEYKMCELVHVVPPSKGRSRRAARRGDLAVAVGARLMGKGQTDPCRAASSARIEWEGLHFWTPAEPAREAARRFMKRDGTFHSRFSPGFREAASARRRSMRLATVGHHTMARLALLTFAR